MRVMLEMMVTYIAESKVLDQRRVNAAASLELLEQRVDEELDTAVLESTLAGLGQGCADGEGDDNIVSVLGLAVKR